VISLQNKVAVVTGGARGIGRTCCMMLAEAGAHVAVSDVDLAGAEQVAADIRGMGREAMAVKTDVSQWADAEQLMEAVLAKFNRLDILVNNAGITRDGLLLRMKPEDWAAVIETDLSSVFRLCKGVLRGMMKARRGRIISIASVVGLVGNPGQANYCAAKAGVIGFSRSLAQEVASRGITVNVVAPGFIDTDMTQALPEEQRQALAARIPAGRLGTPDDVAAAVAFLASPQAAWITGETLNVNGGMYMP